MDAVGATIWPRVVLVPQRVRRADSVHRKATRCYNSSGVQLDQLSFRLRSAL